VCEETPPSGTSVPLLRSTGDTTGRALIDTSGDGKTDDWLVPKVPFAEGALSRGRRAEGHIRVLGCEPTFSAWRPGHWPTRLGTRKQPRRHWVSHDAELLVSAVGTLVFPDEGISSWGRLPFLLVAARLGLLLCLLGKFADLVAGPVPELDLGVKVAAVCGDGFADGYGDFVSPGQVGAGREDFGCACDRDGHDRASGPSGSGESSQTEGAESGRGGDGSFGREREPSTVTQV
jgi:hypothetical protein